jgi:hypothetical protein
LNRQPLGPQPENTVFWGMARNIESFVFSSGYDILGLQGRTGEIGGTFGDFLTKS